MKQPIITFAIIACMMQAQAQDLTIANTPKARLEIYGGYGFLSIQNVLTRIENDWDRSELDFGTDTTISHYHFIGPVQAGFRVFLPRRFSIGLQAGYTRAVSFNTYINSAGYVSNEMRDHFITLMPRFDWHYFNRDIVSLYMGASIGLVAWGIENLDHSRTWEFFPMTHGNLFGIRVGRAIGGFAEFGMGANGVVTVGVSGKF